MSRRARVVRFSPALQISSENKPRNLAERIWSLTSSVDPIAYMTKRAKSLCR